MLLLQRYLHQSRHEHAVKRTRGPGGRFLTAAEKANLREEEGHERMISEDGQAQLAGDSRTADEEHCWPELPSSMIQPCSRSREQSNGSCAPPLADMETYRSEVASMEVLADNSRLDVGSGGKVASCVGVHEYHSLNKPSENLKITVPSS